MEFIEVLFNIIPLAIAYTAPLAVIALGGLYSERSGVVNIGLEGLLGIGAFSTAYFIWLMETSFDLHDPWVIAVGLLVGALMGGLFSLLHAFASVTMRADQVISGTAINMLSLALTVYLARDLTGSGNIQIRNKLVKDSVPFLSNIPVIGVLFTNAYFTNFVVVFIILVSWFLIYKTKFGLRLRACGENPQAADSMGINVLKMRYIGVFISGLLAGLGGGIVILTYAGEFSSLTYNGLGFLALAALIFGKWKPWNVLGAAFFFGFAKTVADMSKIFQGLESMPNIIFNTFPYVITIVALIVFSKNSTGPRAAGEPYDAGKR